MDRLGRHDFPVIVTDPVAQYDHGAGVAVTAPMLAFMVSEFLPGHPLQRMLPHGWLNWILLVLASPVVLAFTGKEK